MSRYALINTLTNKVVNIIVYDGVSHYFPPASCIIKQSDTANAGDTYDGKNIISQGDQ